MPHCVGRDVKRRLMAAIVFLCLPLCSGLRAETAPYGSADKRSNPAFQLAQSNGVVNARLILDSKRNKEFAKLRDGWAAYFGYKAHDAGGVLSVELDSQIYDIWKHGRTVREQSYDQDGYIENPNQFSPVFLTVEVSNDTPQSTQIVGAYLDVANSATDYQPYLEIGSVDRVMCGEGNYAPSFELRNLGWGAVRDAQMVYGFSAKGAVPQQLAYDAKLGSFDQKTTATVDDGLRTAGLDVAKVASGKFRCPSESQVPACFARLKATGIYGNLAPALYTQGNTVFTWVSGQFQYRWTDSAGGSNESKTPFEIVVPIMHFDIGGPECGAAGPDTRDYKTIALSLDRSNYRLPVNMRGQLGSRQDKSFGFALVAPKSSRHLFKVVLQLADGSSVSSEPADLSYFTPRMPAQE